MYGNSEEYGSAHANMHESARIAAVRVSGPGTGRHPDHPYASFIETDREGRPVDVEANMRKAVEMFDL